MKIHSKILFISIGLLLIYNACSSRKSIHKAELKHFEILCDQHALDSIYKNYTEDIYISVKFIKNNDTIPAKMRLRGDSSRKYGKKSLKIVFREDSVPQGEHRKINLNSEWTDKTYIRQYISSKLMQQAGIIGFNSNFVSLKLNGKYWGLYLQIENMDKTFLKKNGLDKKGNLYKATKDGACLSHFDDIKVKWEKKSNKKADWNDLQVLINEVDTIKIEHYKTYLEAKFEYDKLITIIALNMLLQNGSTYYHNYYLYHDINGSGKWQIMPWDMDKTLNYYSWKPYRYHETSSNWESDNPLIEKAFLSNEVLHDIENKVKELGETIFNAKNIHPILNSCKRALSEAVANDETDQIESIKEWKKAIKVEKKYVDNQVENILNQFNSLPKSFELERYSVPVERNITLRWNASEHNNKITYKLVYGKHFLLKKEESKTIENIRDTLCQLTNLKPGKYYWRVYACSATDTVEGFNTKSTFEILPERTLNITNDTVLRKQNSPHSISKTWIIHKGVTLTIEPGCKLLLSENANFAVHGNITAIGNANDSIYFIPDNIAWDQIFSYNTNGNLKFEYCNFVDGYFFSKNSKVSFKNCTYRINKKPLWVNGERKAYFWVHKGSILVDSCVFINDKDSDGEGLNINYADAIVSNSVFDNIADAIEYINVSKGEIKGNLVINSPDDAIDMNGCSNILVANNILVNNTDKAISIGTEQYGPSTNITISNNFIKGNKIGISVKDSSFCKVEKTTFAENKIAIEAHLKNNYKKYVLGGNIEVKTSLFYNNVNNVLFDEHSKAVVYESVSNNELIPGNNNIVEKSEKEFIFEYQENDFQDQKGAKFDSLKQSIIKKYLD